jgi:hypothetical protein
MALSTVDGNLSLKKIKFELGDLVPEKPFFEEVKPLK